VLSAIIVTMFSFYNNRTYNTFAFSMLGLKNAFIIVVVNDPITHWCDYAIQTIHILSKNNQTFVYCSGDCVTWKDLFVRRPILIEKKWGAIFFHPFFIIPGQRNTHIKGLNYRINAILVHLWSMIFVRNKQKIFWFFDSFYISPIIKSFSSFISVYDCVDYYLDMSESIFRQERRLLSQATYVFANSYTLARQLVSYRKDVTVVPLGFAVELFKKCRLSPVAPHTFTVGFVGGITSRIDFSLLIRVAKQCQNILFVFYGEFDKSMHLQDATCPPDCKKFFSLPNVFWKGYIPKTGMPDCINAFDVCCIPYQVTDPFNKYCFPMKVMEYFYVGKPVLSTPIEELERYPELVRIGRTASEWERHIRTLLLTSWPVRLQKEQKKKAEENSWEIKLRKMMDIIVQKN